MVNDTPSLAGFSRVVGNWESGVMSAIVGIYYSDGRSVEREDLGRMVDILAHRGADGVGIWSEGSVGLGHRLLWTTPESLLEYFPLVNQTDDIVLIADARIDNRDELIEALGLKNRPPEKITDGQLILSAYQKWGEDCPEYLLGDFAFAIWDARKQTLFCARDHFGVKPFYYYSSSRAFMFATEIKALLCIPEVPHKLNEVKVAHYLIALLGDNNSTFYQDIFRLPAGHRMTVRSSGTLIQSYWKLDQNRDIRLASDTEYAEAFREIFTEAVRCRLRSAFSIGSYLSGGLDSSSIACTARNFLQEKGCTPLHTFSAIFEKVTQCDERPFQNAVLAQGGFEPHYFLADHTRPFTDNLDNVLWHQDEAFLGGNFYFNWGMQGLANQLGIRVLLSGFDGDTTVSHGNEYLRELARAGKWQTLAMETREYGRKHNLPWKKILWNWYWHYGIKKRFSESLILQPLKGIYQTLHRAKPAVENPLWSIPLNPDFVKRINLAEKISAVTPALFKTEKERHHYWLTSDVMQHALESEDKSAAAFSIESRYPFCDKRLIEFCLALPSNQKLHMGYTRIVMRRAMEGILPQEVQWRPGKANFTPSLERGLLAYERERLEQVILKNPEVFEAYVDVTATRQAYKRLVSDSASEDDVNSLWRTVFLSLWLSNAKLTS